MSTDASHEQVAEDVTEDPCEVAYRADLALVERGIGVLEEEDPSLYEFCWAVRRLVGMA